MAALGELVQFVGTWTAVGGYALWAGTLLFRVVGTIWLRRWFMGALVIGFYARAAATVGIMAVITGAILRGALPWFMLILVFVIGAPSLALLLVRPVTADPASFGFGRQRKP